MNRATEFDTPHVANRSYRDVLRNRHVAGLLLGDLLANAGTGMIIVAMPVRTLSTHGSVPKAIAIGLVDAAPFVLSTILALARRFLFSNGLTPVRRNNYLEGWRPQPAQL